MKTLFLAVLLIFTLNVKAEKVTFDFNEVKIRDFLKVAYGQVLKRSYVVESGVLDDNKRISMYLRDIEENLADLEIRRILEEQGLTVEENNGVISVQKRINFEGAELYIYRPKNRSATYLMDVALMLFPRESFTQQRRLQYAGGMSGMSGTSMSGEGTSSMSASPLSGSMGSSNSANLEEVDVIVFRGRRAQIARLDKLFRELDIPQPQVLIKAALYEVQTTKQEGSAVDLALSLLSGKFGLDLSGGASAMGSGVSVKLSSGVNLSGVYSALSKDERFKMISSPRLRVKSGISASFSVGTETPVLSSVSYDNVGRPIQSVTYRPSGVLFKVLPRIREDRIDIHMSQQISDFVATTNGVNGTPTLLNREIVTDVVLGREDLVVIGGLDETKQTENEHGLSFLPSFLRSDNSEDIRREIILLMQVERI
jgi:type II secretory pathway component GspD/PulD (secretin)